MAHLMVDPPTYTTPRDTISVSLTAISPGTAQTADQIANVMWLEPQKGTAGQTSVAGMVEFLEPGNTAKVAGQSGPAEVKVAKRGSIRYIRTEADGQPTNNLLQLPRF